MNSNAPRHHHGSTIFDVSNRTLRPPMNQSTVRHLNNIIELPTYLPPPDLFIKTLATRRFLINQRGNSKKIQPSSLTTTMTMSINSHLPFSFLLLPQPYFHLNPCKQGSTVHTIQYTKSATQKIKAKGFAPRTTKTNPSIHPYIRFTPKPKIQTPKPQPQISTSVRKKRKKKERQKGRVPLIN